MTDKQIIIDGVDISGCEYACNTAFGKNGCKHSMMKNIYCSENPNCYFKQLALKTQECEELKEKYEEVKEDRYNLNMEMYVLDRYRKALEEIKKVCIEYTHEFADGATVHYYSLDEILDIINKAKGDN